MKYLPSREMLEKNKHFKKIQKFTNDPNLFHFNCHSVATAVSIGLFIGYLPIPGHMILAALLCAALRANLPLAVMLVWISNPFTIPLMFYIAYRVGAHVLGTPPETFHLEANYHWFIHELDHFAWPIIVGALICGTTLALLGNMMVRLYYYAKG